MYIYKYFFVKPSSEFPEEDIDAYFIRRCNDYQDSVTSGYIIGSMFNAREMVQKMYFSDETRRAHNMDVNVITITVPQVQSTFGDEPQEPIEFLNTLVVPTDPVNSVVTGADQVDGVSYQ